MESRKKLDKLKVSLVLSDSVFSTRKKVTKRGNRGDFQKKSGMMQIECIVKPLTLNAKIIRQLIVFVCDSKAFSLSNYYYNL